MRLGTAALLLVVGCSSEVARDATQLPQDDVSVLTATDTTVESAPTAIDSPSASSREAEPTHRSVKPTIPHLERAEPPSCPVPASTCSSSCVPITGRRFDEANQCALPVVVGCWPRDGFLNTDALCLRRGDGVILTASSSYRRKLGSNWRVCGTNEAGFDAAPCPGGSAPSP